MEYCNSDFYITVYIYWQFTYRVTSRLYVGCWQPIKGKSPYWNIQNTSAYSMSQSVNKNKYLWLWMIQLLNVYVLRARKQNPFDIFRQVGEERVCNIFVMSYVKPGICGMSVEAESPAM